MVSSRTISASQSEKNALLKWYARQESKAKITVITLVTLNVLCALASVIMGILVLVSSLQGISGLGALSQLGWPLGTVFISAGILSAGILAVVAAIYSRRCKKLQANSPSAQASQVEPDPKPKQSTPEETRLNLEALRALTFDQISALSDTEKLYYLPLFSEQQLQDKNFPFPWGQFLPLPGFGSALRYINSSVLKNSYLPWSELVKYPKELDHVFGEIDVSRQRIDRKRNIAQEPSQNFIRTIFESLDCDVITALAPKLTMKHLPFFSEQKLKEDQFPWDLFMEKDDFADQISLIHSSVLVKAAIPWKNLAKNPQKLQSTFHGKHKKLVGREWNDEFTENIFASLTYNVIQELAPHLTVDHLFLFPVAKRKGVFPWTMFAQKKGFGATMFLQCELEVFQSQHFPWNDLAQEQEFKALLGDPAHTYVIRVQKIVQAIPVHKITNMPLRTIVYPAYSQHMSPEQNEAITHSILYKKKH